MKTKEELNALKEEVETLNKKLYELTDEELAQVSGGGNNEIFVCYPKAVIVAPRDVVPTYVCSNPYMKGKNEYCETCPAY